MTFSPRSLLEISRRWRAVRRKAPVNDQADQPPPIDPNPFVDGLDDMEARRRDQARRAVEPMPEAAA